MKIHYPCGVGGSMRPGDIVVTKETPPDAMAGLVYVSPGVQRWVVVPPTTVGVVIEIDPEDSRHVHVLLPAGPAWIHVQWLSPAP